MSIDRAERGDPADETVINGTPYDAHKGMPGGQEKRATLDHRPDAQLAQEIKRRQIALTVRYVAALRAR